MAKTAEAVAALRANDRILAGAGLAALVGAMLAGCTTTTTRAPVEDRALERPAAAAPATAPAPATGSYTVRRNDTLYSIAWRHDLDYKALAAANGIEAPYTIYPGRRLRLPAGGAVAAVQPPASTVRKPAPATAVPKARARQEREKAAPPPPKPAQPQTTVEPPRPGPATVSPAPKPSAPAPSKRAAPKPKAAPPAKAPSPAKPLPAKPGGSSTAVAGWQRPVSEKPVRAFGGASKGLDYALPPATRVRAAAPGVVVYAGPGLGGFRHLVIVKASERYLVAYGINVQPRLQEGETVAAGATVAETGSGGAAGKFHFEVRDRGKPVDPRPLVGGA